MPVPAAASTAWAAPRPAPTRVRNRPWPCSPPSSTGARWAPGVVMNEPPLAVPLGPRLRPDAGRVITRLFVPGEELPESASRGRSVIDRILGLEEDDIAASMAELTTRFAGRHRDLGSVLREHFDIAAHGRSDLAGLPEDRRLLIGAYFTMEFAVESAALCNPSMVAHPDQSGLAPGEVRFVMSVRAVGEGHLSCVEFRTWCRRTGAGAHHRRPRPGTGRRHRATRHVSP